MFTKKEYLNTIKPFEYILAAETALEAARRKETIFAEMKSMGIKSPDSWYRAFLKEVSRN